MIWYSVENENENWKQIINWNGGNQYAIDGKPKDFGFVMLHCSRSYTNIVSFVFILIRFPFFAFIHSLFLYLECAAFNLRIPFVCHGSSALSLSISKCQLMFQIFFHSFCAVWIRYLLLASKDPSRLHLDLATICDKTFKYKSNEEFNETTWRKRQKSLFFCDNYNFLISLRRQFIFNSDYISTVVYTWASVVGIIFLDRIKWRKSVWFNENKVENVRICLFSTNERNPSQLN